MFEKFTPRDPRRPLSSGARSAVVLGAIVAAPVLYLAVYMSVAMSFAVRYPVSGFITWGIITVAAVATVILVERRGPHDWYLRGAVWTLLLIVLASCYFGFIVAQFVHEMKDF